MSSYVKYKASRGSLAYGGSSYVRYPASGPPPPPPTVNTESIYVPAAVEYVQFASGVNAVSSTDSFSFSVWAQVGVNQHYREFFNKYDPTTPFKGYSFEFNAVNSLSVYIGNNDFFNRIQIDSPPLDNCVGSWHHYAFTYDGSMSHLGVHMYVDGVEQSHNNIRDDLTGAIDSVAPFRIFISGEGSFTFSGQQSNLSCWNTNLTSAQINTLYNNGIPQDISAVSFVSNCTHWWALGDGDSASGVVDKIGTANGTMVGIGAGNFVPNPALVLNPPATPTVANRLLWLNAGTIAGSDGSSVGYWKDQSGLAHDFTVQTAFPVLKTNSINGQPVVRFDGSTNKLISKADTFAILSQTAFTTFIVCRIVNITSDNAATNGSTSAFFNNYLISDSFTGQGVFLRSTGPQAQSAYYNGSTTAYANDNFSINTPVIIVQWYNGTNIGMQINNNTMVVTASPGALSTPAGYALQLCFNENNNAYTQADIAEIICDNIALSPTQIASQLATLNAKYAIY